MQSLQITVYTWCRAKQAMLNMVWLSHFSNLEPTGLYRFACPPLEIQSAKAKHVTREILRVSATDVPYIYIHLYMNKNRIIKARRNDSHTQWHNVHSGGITKRAAKCITAKHVGARLDVLSFYSKGWNFGNIYIKWRQQELANAFLLVRRVWRGNKINKNEEKHARHCLLIIKSFWKCLNFLSSSHSTKTSLLRRLNYS